MIAPDLARQPAARRRPLRTLSFVGVNRTRQARAARKRKRRMDAADNDLTAAQWAAIRAAWGGCAYCGTTDEAMPICPQYIPSVFGSSPLLRTSSPVALDPQVLGVVCGADGPPDQGWSCSIRGERGLLDCLRSWAPAGRLWSDGGVCGGTGGTRPHAAPSLPQPPWPGPSRPASYVADSSEVRATRAPRYVTFR